MSYVKEPFKEIDVMNYFMFNKLTTQKETSEKFCRCMIRNLLGREVGDVIIKAESIYLPDNPEKRGVRLDVEVKEYGEGKNVVSIYDIEPHRDEESAYPKKNRFQQAQIDKNNLESGDNNFEHLPELFIMCITNYDPFGYDQVLYTIKNTCVEEPELVYNDGVTILYFNTTGTKGGTESLKRFLTYLEDSKDKNAIDEATREVKNYVDIIRHNNEIEGTYMTLGDLMDKWKAEIIEEKEAESRQILQETIERITEEKDKQLKEKDEEILRYKKLYEDAIKIHNANE